MSLARDITTVGGGTLMSRLPAYVRDAWIAALLGAGPYSETLFAVLQVVNFFRRLLSEGALNSAFVPIWTKLHGSTDGAANANRFTWRVLLMMFCVAGSIALFGVFFGHYVIAGVAPGFDDTLRSFSAFPAVHGRALYLACGARRGDSRRSQCRRSGRRRRHHDGLVQFDHAARTAAAA